MIFIPCLSFVISSISGLFIGDTSRRGVRIRSALRRPRALQPTFRNDEKARFVPFAQHTFVNVSPTTL